MAIILTDFATDKKSLRVLEQITHQIEAHIARHGEYRVAKTSGVFVGIKVG